MLFNNKIAVDKSQQKLYNRSKQMIADMITSNNQLQEDHLMKLQEEVSHTRPIGRKVANRRLFAKKTQLQESLTHQLFMEELYDTYRRSLLLDEDFKDAQDANLYSLFESVFTNMMNEGFFSWDSIKNGDCAFTTKLYALCEEIAQVSADKAVNMDTAKKMKVSDDALINEKDDEEDKKEDTDKEEKEKDDDKKSSKKKDEETVDENDKKKIDEEVENDKEELSDAVKEKVAKTIKDEKERSEKEEEDTEQVKELSKTDKELEEEEAEGESDNEDFDDSDGDSEDDNNDSDDEDDDLKDDSKDDTDDDEDDDKKDKKEDSKKSEAMSFGRVMLHPNKFKNNSLFRSIQMNVAGKFIKEKQAGLISEDVSMNMDMLFAESLAYYTLLETFNTIKLTNLYPSDAKKICKRLILED